MMNVEAVVIELSEDNVYHVYIGGMDYRTVSDNGEYDDCDSFPADNFTEAFEEA